MSQDSWNSLLDSSIIHGRTRPGNGAHNHQPERPSDRNVKASPLMRLPARATDKKSPIQQKDRLFGKRPGTTKTQTTTINASTSFAHNAILLVCIGLRDDRWEGPTKWKKSENSINMPAVRLFLRYLYPLLFQTINW
jgi:hypothetical protein